MIRLHFVISLLMLLLTAVPTDGLAATPIRGSQEVDVEQMYQYVAARNSSFSREIAEAFHEIGEIYGIRGDIAMCQAIIETGWFRFDNGTAVTPDAHNYCGLGVKKRGDKGCRFNSIREGVTAMIQHLYAYSCKDEIPVGEMVIDPRFAYVKRGSATSWESLSGKWAMNKYYGSNILNLYDRMLRHETTPMTVLSIEVDIPEHLLLENDDAPKYNFMD